MSKEQQIIDILSLNPFISQKDLARQVGLSRPAVANYIAKLTKDGIIKGRAYILQKDTVLCIGAANIDQEAKTIERIQYNTSNPVEITESIGGVARNFASTLQQLGINTSLLTAVGDDPAGDQLLRQTKSEGIDISHVWTFPAARTGIYTAIINKTGDNILSLADMSIYEKITKEMINDKWPHIQSAKAIFLDTNFNKDILNHLLDRLKEHKIPVYIDGVSPIKVKKLPEDLTNIKLLTLSPKEVKTLTKEEDLVEGAKSLIDRGAENLLVISNEEGITYATKKGLGSLPYKENFSIHTDKEKNKISAKIMYGLLRGKTLQETIEESLPS